MWKVTLLSLVAHGHGQTVACGAGEPAPPTNLVTPSQIAAHSQTSDCWMRIGCGVYQIGSYRHGGPQTSVTDWCGGDATSSFKSQHGTRWSKLSSIISRGGALVGRYATSAPVQAPTRAPNPAPGQAPFLAPTPAAVQTPAPVSAPITSSLAPTVKPQAPAPVNAPTTPNPAPTVAAQGVQCRSDEPSPPDTKYTKDDLLAHNTQSDCWMQIGCGVYDINQYSHSGGSIIYGFCGTDGTDGFTGQHPWSYLQVMINKGGRLVGRFSGDSAGPSQELVTATTLATHYTPGDCWMCIGGKVYDFSFYVTGSPPHPGGRQVIEEMCGHEASATYFTTHKKDWLSVGVEKGPCTDPVGDVSSAQIVIDSVAFAAYLVPPLIYSYVMFYCLDNRMKDRFLRRPVAAPLKQKQLGHFFDVYLEMPLGVFCLLAYYLLVTSILFLWWMIHYNAYYPAETRLKGALGRMNVYLLSIATVLGSRRSTISWFLLQIPYEKTLKAHYVVGNVSCIFMLVHGALYLFDFGRFIGSTRQIFIICVIVTFVLVVFPIALITNIRIWWYKLFRFTHVLAPFIVMLTVLHIVFLAFDGPIFDGFKAAIGWLVATSLMWLSDFLYACYDFWFRPTALVSKPKLLIDVDGENVHIIVTFVKHTVIKPGSWMQVQFGSVVGHPFTALVQDTGFLKKQAKFEFVWKVIPGKTWTSDLRKKIADRSDETTPSPWDFHVTGPFGGGLGSMATLDIIVFVVSGVGVTPAASLVPHLLSQGKIVTVIWSSRSYELITHIYNGYFSPEVCTTSNTSENHIHLTNLKAIPASSNSSKSITVSTNSKNARGAKTARNAKPATFELPAYIKKGRPSVPTILETFVQKATDLKLCDVGIFLCGPKALISETMAAARSLNMKQRGVFFHAHAESFQF